jgi:large subunit ribosomal protein L10
MPKTRQQKQADLDELIEKFKAAKSVVMAEYRGTSVKDISTFRAKMRSEQVFTKVYKMTLVNKALEALGLKAKVDYKQPVVLNISSEDEVAPARILKGVAKDIKTIGILSGIVGGQLLTKEQMVVLADLPSKQELRGQLVGTMNAPVTGFVNVLAGNLRGLINVLNAVAGK